MNAYQDRQGDVWFEILPDRVTMVNTVVRAKRIKASGYQGVPIKGVWLNYGPLTLLTAKEKA